MKYAPFGIVALLGVLMIGLSPVAAAQDTAAESNDTMVAHRVVEHIHHNHDTFHGELGHTCCHTHNTEEEWNESDYAPERWKASETYESAASRHMRNPRPVARNDRGKYWK